jgi:vancomycin resistance protein YoaR
LDLPSSVLRILPVVPAHSKSLRVRSIPGLFPALLVVGGLIVAAGIAYGVAFLLVGSGVLPNTTVAGTPIGKFSITAAQAKVNSALGPKARAPLALTASGQSLTLDPVTAGLTVDARATVAQGGHRSASPMSLWKALFAHRTLTPVLAVDAGKLNAAVTALNGTLVGGGHDGSITFQGVTPVAVAPTRGIAIVHDKAVAAIKGAYFTSSAPVVLPVEPVEPSVTSAEVQRVLTTIARPAVAAPISLLIGSTTTSVSPAVIAKNLTFVSSGGKLAPVVNGAGIAAMLDAATLATLKRSSKDASFDVSSGTPVIVPAVVGGTPDLSNLGPDVAAVLSQAAPRTIAVPSVGIEPAFTTADAQALDIKEVVSTFTTHHPCCASRVKNIHTIANIVNGALIKPGETFSLNKFVGPRDTKRGFVEAPMIEDGLFINSVGGGVSQFATTLYNAVFFAGLKDIEHHPHSYYISRYPVGREATVSYPDPNLIFQNDMPTGIVITTSYTGTSLTVTFWGTKHYDVTSSASARYSPTTAGIRYNPRTDCEAAAGEPGFQVDVTQTVKQNGVVVQTNHLHTRYDPEPIIICGPSPSPTPGGSGVPGSPIPGAPTVAAPTATLSPKPSPAPSH